MQQVLVLAAVTANSHISIRQKYRSLSMYKILRLHWFHPYHVNLLHDLHVEDFNNKIRFCGWSEDYGKFAVF